MMSQIELILILFEYYHLKRIFNMSISQDKIKLLDSRESRQESFFNGHEEDADLPPTELSGDENGQQSVYSQVDNSKKSNFILTVTTIIKTVIGSGILGLPFTVSKCGYVFAAIVFLLATALSHYSSVLLLNAKNLSGHSNFSTILHHLYQNKFCKSLGSILIFLNNIGICILEIIIFKVSIRKILTNIYPEGDPVLEQFYTSQIFIALLISVLEIPSILVKKIQSLKFMAFIGVAGILVFVTAFVVHYSIKFSDYEPLAENKSMDLFPQDWFKAIASIPNLILALSFQMNFFPVYKGMRKVSDKRMSLAALSGVLVCSVSYLLVGILGYHLIYSIDNQKVVQANFLTSLSYDKINHVLYYIINCGFLLSVFFAFPIMFFGCRNNFIALMQLLLAKSQQAAAKKWRQSTDNIEQISSYVQSQDKVQKRKKASRLYYIYTFSIFLVIVAIGVSVDDIEIVFNLIGAISATSIGVLLPCFFYFMLVIKKNKARNVKFYLSIGVFLIMAPFAIFSIVANYVG